MCRKIVIADDEPITRMDIAEILEEAGYNVVGQAVDGFDAVELCKKHKPDLVVMDVKMPLLDGLKASKIINEEGSAYSGKEFVEQAKGIGVLSYLVKPISEKSLIPSVEIAIGKSEEIEKIKEESQKISEKLESRIVIEKAKGILINKEDMTEDAAYNYIRKLSMNKRCSMKDIAEALICNSRTG